MVSDVKFTTSPGIIPAYAGQILKENYNDSLYRDHPRIRGTNNATAIIIRHGTGSSPHTRDKFQLVEAKGFNIRIIPAYAGQILKDPLK